LRRYKVDEQVLKGAKETQEIRTKVIDYIRTYNQLRDLEDKNLENKNALKYAESRSEFFRNIVNKLQKDDLGGYMYQDVKGYDLEELIQIATDLESKIMVLLNSPGK
jgi:ubiquinone biosynthesis protein Coq4